MSVIPLNNIRIQVLANSWQDAITKAGSILLENKDIEQEYVQAMIDAVINMGPYIVLSPGFALAHAEPSEHVIRNSMSLITLEEPVSFGSVNDPVSVILCIACIDKSSHIDSLQKIAGKLISDGVIEKIATCKSNDELYKLINN